MLFDFTFGNLADLALAVFLVSRLWIRPEHLAELRELRVLLHLHLDAQHEHLDDVFHALHRRPRGPQLVVHYISFSIRSLSHCFIML